MLTFGKTFVRKITIGNVAYLVEQDKVKKTITIKHKRSDKLLYSYNSLTDTLEYDVNDKGLIMFIFELANIERFMI